jgi:hypothetical protein
VKIYLKYLILSIFLQLIFSELISINGVQPNILLLFVIFSSLTISNASLSTILGFLLGFVGELIFYSGTILGISSFTFSLVGFFASKVSNNFVYRNFDFYWIVFTVLGIFIFSIFKYEFYFLSNLKFILSPIYICIYTIFVGLILDRLLSLKNEILNAQN